MFLYSAWMELNIGTRQRIAGHFGIVKRGSTEVVDNQIKSDGYNIKEIEQALNIDAIQTFLNVQETDMAKLWVRLVDKIEGRIIDDIQPPVKDPVFQIRPENEMEVMPPKNKSGRPRKIKHV